MDIPIEDLLNATQQNEIKEQFKGLSADPIVGFCRAAIAESADAILGHRLEQSTLREYRLFRLIMNAFDGAIPSETMVSNLFGIPEKRALSMISNIRKRYRVEMEKGWIAAVKTALDAKEAAKDKAGNDIFRFRAPVSVIEYLKDIVGGLKDGKLAPIDKVRGMADRYEITIDTHNAVCDKLGIRQKK